MGLPSLKDKLESELNKDIKEESQVVYILSRVRKILESDSKEKKYKVLKLYCDWALHTEIENIEPIKDLLEGVIADDNTAQLSFILFEPFHKEFHEFLTEYNLSKRIYQGTLNRGMFNRFLSQIYSDTPLVLKEIKKRKVRWIDNTDPNSPGSSRSGSFKIE